MERIGLIAGNGQFPILFSKAAASRGFSVFAVAHLNETDPGLEDHVHGIEWIHVGQLGRLIRFFKRNRIDQVVMVGGINKTRMFTDVKPDFTAIRLLTRMRHTNDDGLLGGFAGVLESEGIRVRPSTLLMPELLTPAGCWTRRKPKRSELKDVRLGWRLAKAVGELDIGQCVVVGRGSILAVEAIDGTDATIRRGGRLGQGRAVVVKVFKPGQDERFDMPAVGLETIRAMAESRVRVLAVEAGKAIVFDREKMIEAADLGGISIVGVKADDMKGFQDNTI
ncbi:MAG: LpxI family protein [Desulfobacterales bacterium]